MKLPAFYLLDAISKNVYEPYACRFTSFVVPLYLETYSQVDEGTRGKMEEMLLTWRTGSPTGKELFGVPQQIAIERGVWGDGGTSNSVSLPFFFYAMPHLLYSPASILAQAKSQNPKS
jgi:pre-mRNA cleavage complex 2 protein Pcf11